MSTDGLKSAMKIQAAYMLQHVNVCRLGLVTGTRPDLQAVKVTIQPENVQTGWLPVITPMAGNGWGLVSHLSYEDQVVVLFQEGDLGCGVVIGALFSQVDNMPDAQKPPADTQGQFWLQHKSGSLLTFTNDGKVTLTSNGDMNITAGGDMNINASGNINFQKTINVEGNVDSTGTVTAQTDVKAGAEPVSLVEHVHVGVQTGSGVSGPPE
jgi:phage baseplate assembly protein V